MPPDQDTARLRRVPPAPPVAPVPPRPTRPPAPPPAAFTTPATAPGPQLPPPPAAFKVAHRPSWPPGEPPARAFTEGPAGAPYLPPPSHRRPAGPADPGDPGQATAGPPHPPYTRRPGTTAAALACVILGVGLIGGAVTGSWLTDESSADPASAAGYASLRALWHSTPVDTFFPPTLTGDAAGPGGADRTWTRIAVAPDGVCAGAFDPLLLKTLRTVGCERVLRATYVDVTNSAVVTVGMAFTKAEPAAMEALDARFTGEKLAERADLMPRTYPVTGTVAASFGDGQRASWTVNVLTEAPVVVYAVSGFADGRDVRDPQPAARAAADGARTTVAQAGLGHDAQGVAERIGRGLRTTVSTATEPPG
ncbi:hypothetical protein OG875_26210 [Streptomyces sp. NBC_01498]|uniref:hypothetical protein n=1 Tax=Streptomyces sp. NBC_01498 TaxID=2975870 RepID=UPI002E7B6FB1|nr:hypothetical protein [Streptomyces sp. NBC_01498]WTL27757.1 hypothetical protein OG875_26210 [Streptomyces sp. NBC_01498]